MKEKNHQFCRFWPLVILAVIGTVWAVDRQEVIDYYWRNATKAYGAHDPVGSGGAIAFTATASIRQLTRGGKASHTDTSVNRSYYSVGKLDSTAWVRGKANPTFPIDVTVPNIFDSTYIRTLFPNDRGEGELAIGFDTDSVSDPRPVGIVTIDRNEYTIRRLHLAYHGKPGFLRFSRSFHFVDIGGWVVPDSIVETGALRGFLVNEDYQIVINISDVEISSKLVPARGE